MGINTETEAVLLQAYQEKTGFSAKDHHAGKDGNQQENRKGKEEMDWFPKKVTGLSLEELCGAFETGKFRDRSFIGMP